MLVHFFVFGQQAWLTILQNAVCYLMMRWLPQAYSHRAVFATLALCLVAAHLNRQFFHTDYSFLDVHMYQMMNFCKVSSLVCAASDGEKIKRLGKAKADLRSRELEFANEEGRPSLKDYWAYLYFCGGAISGPWFEFRDF